MANFFIDRPIFAWVIGIVIMLVGALAMRSLPISRYPDIAPPQVSITATYPGASAVAVEQAVTQVIEQQMTGLDGMRYISSASDSSGVASLTVTFETGTDPDIAQVQVQNKLARATPMLPEDVQRQGVVVSKGGSGFLMVAALTAPKGSHDRTDLGDYIVTNLLDPVSRVPGVGSTTLFGAGYAMRVWLIPEKLDQYGIAPSDVIAAIRSQNTQVSAGSLGSEPAVKGQSYTTTISVQSLKSTPEEFIEMPLRTTATGATVRLGDVAKVEIGAQSYGFETAYNGSPAAGFAITLATGANALETADAVKALLKQLSTAMPPDMELVYPYETTPFVRASIEEVKTTLIEAIVLVLIVIFVFLQSPRATFPPMVAIPVVLLGTFAVMAVAGFSINMLTMFAMVLAIGLLVDDAIVVVENVERLMHDEGLSALEATRKSMQQITGALVGIVIVLCAVFVPMAFFPGSTGVIYRQFSLTIIAAMVLSLTVAVVLTPAICARLLKQQAHGGAGKRPNKPAEWFNRGFNRLTDGYVGMVEGILRWRGVFVVVFAVLVLLTAWGFQRLPTAFLPEEDQSSVMAMVQLPSDASMERTTKYLQQLSQNIRAQETGNLNGVFTVSGFSFAGRGPNQGLAFMSAKDWSERTREEQSTMAMALRTNKLMAGNPDGFGVSFIPPAIPELGSANGFDLFVQDTAGAGRLALNQAMMQVVGAAQQDKTLSSVRPNEQAPKPMFNVDIDYRKAQAFGVQPADITSLMAVTLGGSYVNDFLDRGRIKRVMLQGETEARMQPEDLGRWRVRNASGTMVPLNELVSSHWQNTAPRLNRYNGLPAVNIQGAASPGQSSGDAMLAMENIIGKVPGGFGFEWNGISAEERQAGGQASLLYLLSVVFIFLCLAALYESWTIPVAVLMAAPIGVMGAVLAVSLRGLSNDVFFQVGILTTVGLAAKNAILIVEFARELEHKGSELIDATLHAARMRLRPILMTSFAFGLGVLPLAIGTGAGAGARVAIGTSVLGGMIASTLLGILFTPLFYVVIRSMENAWRSFFKPGPPRATAQGGLS